MSEIIKPDQNDIFPNSNFEFVDEHITMEEPELESRSLRPLFNQCIAVLAIFIINIPNGLITGQTASMIPQIENPNSTLDVDVSTGSWIVSITALSTVLGSFIGGWLMDVWGRKWTHIASALVYSLGFLLMAVTTNVSLLLFGRFISGIACGVLSSAGPAYIAEICSPNSRSIFIPSLNLSNSIGILIVHLWGIYYNWRITSYLCAIIPLLPIFIFIFAKESPFWLIKQGRIEEGTKAFYWYRGEEGDEKLELQKTVESIQESNDNNQSLSANMRYFKRPEVWKPTVITSAFFLISQVSGVNALIAYTQQMIASTVGSGISEVTSMLSIDILRLITSGFSCLSVRFIKRRTLGLWGLSLTVLSLYGLSAYVYESESSTAINKMVWLPLVLLVFYASIASISIVPLPYVLCGEMFPTQVRGPCSGFSSAMGLFGSFLVTKTAPGLFIAIGFAGTYFLYGSLTLFGCLVMYVVLPETKGKTLIAIEEQFKSRKNKHERMN